MISASASYEILRKALEQKIAREFLDLDSLTFCSTDSIDNPSVLEVNNRGDIITKQKNKKTEEELNNL